MGKGGRIAGTILATLAGLMIFGAQTGPEDAKTNIAAWYKEIINLDPPSWLTVPYLDTWVSLAGGLILTVAIYMIAPRWISHWRNVVASWLRRYEFQWPIRRTVVSVDMKPNSGSQSLPPPEASKSLVETPEELNAKHDLAVFIADHVIPTYRATTALQEAIVRAICGPYTVIGDLAWKAFQNEENMRQYIEHINKLDRAIEDGIGDMPLHQLVDIVYNVSELHHALCSFNNWLAFAPARRFGAPFDYKSNEATAELYQKWRERQDALVTAFQPFRRDIRFPRFYDLSGKRGLGHPFETDA